MVRNMSIDNTRNSRDTACGPQRELNNVYLSFPNPYPNPNPSYTAQKPTSDVDLILAQGPISFRVTKVQALARPPAGVSALPTLVFSCGLIGFLSAYTTPEPSEVAQTSIQFTEQHNKSLICMSGHPEIYIVHTCCTSKMPRWGEYGADRSLLESPEGRPDEGSEQT